MTLKELRLSKWLSQIKMANLIGISMAAYRSYEYGFAMPTQSNYDKIVNCLGECPSDIDLGHIGRPVG